MSPRDTIDALRAAVPLAENAREPLEAPEIKAVPLVPLKKTKSEIKNDFEASGRLPDPGADLTEDIREYAEERAAVLEYEQGFTRKDAEREAVRRAVIRYRLNEFYGDPPIQGGGVVIGDNVAELVAGLRLRYGARLLEI